MGSTRYPEPLRTGCAQTAMATATASCSLQAAPAAMAALALLRTHRAMEALNKFASYRNAEAEAGELMLVGIAVRKTGKARCGVSFPLRREDEGELMDRAREIHPECARKLEGSGCCGAAGLDLIIEDRESRPASAGPGTQPSGCRAGGTPRLPVSRGRWLPPFGRPRMR